MDDVSDFLRDNDPDINYYDNLIDQNNLFSSFNSISEFLDSNTNDNKFLTIFSQNIRSLNCNLDNFLLLFPSNKMPDLFIFSETWHDLNTPVFIPGYDSHHITRHGRSGGVSIFFKSQLNVCLVPELSISNVNIEICTVKLTNSTDVFYISGVYRPQSGTIDDFNYQMEDILNNRLLLNKFCIIAGDFNVNLFSEDNNVQRFTDMMRSHHFIQTITNLTRPNTVDLASSTLIDHVWVNKLTNYHAGTIATGTTDHHSIFLQLPFISNQCNSTKIKITFRDCSARNEQVFANNLLAFDWNTLKTDDVNSYTLNFVNTLNNIYRDSFPLKSKFVTTKYFLNPWHTKNLKHLTKIKANYYDLFMKGLVSHEKFARFRNKITSTVRKAKETYYNKLFTRNINDTKATWRLINKICFNFQKKSINNISVNNIIYDRSEDMAELFNEFFVNIAENLALNLPNSIESPYTHVQPNQNFLSVFNPISMDELSCIISSLKITKQDVNHISVEMFKKYSNCFLPIICDIFNLCFASGTFPGCFKHATVIPIFKKGDASNMTNYRPIALLPFISKIIERCIYNRLNEFAVENNILSSNQFGFRKGKSTQDAIFLLTEQIYNCFNEGGGTFCINIFIDFQKCFDTIDHDILINKLSLYGIKDIALTLLRSYLSNRTQSVRIDNNPCSSPLSINRGIPQGSILGPLLFLYFINDLPNISNVFTPILFADDTTLSFKCRNVEVASAVCTNELGKFFEWSNANKLTINKNKTFFINHTFYQPNQDSIKIAMNDHELERLDECMFLGLKIDKKLNFSSHIDLISEKISKSIGVLYKLKSLNTPKSILKQIYFSLIHSYLSYTICTYAGTYAIHLNRLLLLQKRALRIINNVSYLAHTDTLFFSNKILKIHDMYKLSIGLYMYEHFNEYSRTHEHYTRGHNDLLQAQSRLCVTSNSIHVIGPKIFNSIPIEIRAKPSKNTFKYYYKQHLLSQYSGLQ